MSFTNQQEVPIFWIYVFTSNDDMIRKCEIIKNDKISDHSLVILDLMTVQDVPVMTKMFNHCMTNLVTYNIDDASDNQ